jgi:putative tryptophan/tyrosine transport system substrate-binding protein
MRRSRRKNVNMKLLIWLLATVLLTTARIAEAQQPTKVARIGYLFTGLQPPTEFLEALGKLGFVEGKNMAFEYRTAEGKEERLPELATELVRLKVDVIVAPGVGAARAVWEATKTIPIIYMGSGDPVASGLVASLARPGGNVTGITTLGLELTAKRLELIKESFPSVSRVALLTRSADAVTDLRVKETQDASRSLGLKLQIVQVKGANDFDKAFSAIIKELAGAVVERPSVLFHTHRKRIVEFANQKRLPSIFHSRDFVDAGGLMCYGESTAQSLRRVASYVDKILRGAKPADLPVEQPTKFELVVNLKTAKQIGVTIPPNVLARADRVIR